MQLVWLETPTNPTLTVVDIRTCADVVRRHPGVLVAVDNSFMSPYFQVCGKRTGLSPVPGELETPLGKGGTTKELQFWSLCCKITCSGSSPSPGAAACAPVKGVSVPQKSQNSVLPDGNQSS